MVPPLLSIPVLTPDLTTSRHIETGRRPARPVVLLAFVEIWSQFHGGNPPATTMGYVTALAQPALKVEVEAWAARW
jgi:enamine deaminase RidA (YjgF/YER057c/UK114 family)